ncbi:MAG: 3-dehydroquinate dehydratase [Solirubrobacterales bacterium]|nr:3-dehydroquinate dehydratase [Solirubrobacterales bacterium]
MGNRNRIAVLHGVNLDQLAVRPSEHYGQLSFDELERQIGEYASELGLQCRFFQTNHEGEFVEHLHSLAGMADAIILNPGAWTHYAWSLHDALELTGLPAVEVHLSDVSKREEWRQLSVISDVCIATVSGKGVQGYREALSLLRAQLGQ